MTRFVFAIAFAASLTLTASDAGATDGGFPGNTPGASSTAAPSQFEAAGGEELLAQRRRRERGNTAAQQATVSAHTYGSDPWHLTGQPVRGPGDALVTIVEFSDFQCPFCTRGAQVIDSLLSSDEFAPSIRVVFMQYPLPFHDHAYVAAQASLAAHAQGAFWPMHDLLFENQHALTRSDLIGYATQLGLDVDAFTTALDEEEFFARVDQHMLVGADLGVRGTPSFMINGQIVVGAQPRQAFETVIRQERELMLELIAGGMTRDEAYNVRVQAGLDATAAAAAPTTPTPEPDLEQPVYVDLTGRPSQGPADAPIVLIEFGEYECPYTSRAEATILALMEEYPDQIRRVWVNFPLAFHSNAEPAALAAIAAHEQGLFWPLHMVMVEHPTALSESDIRSYAALAGVDLAFWEPGAPSADQQARMELDVVTAENVLVRGTPTFLINGRRVQGAQPIEAFRTAVDAALAEAQPHLDAGVAPAEIYETVLRDAPSSIRMME